MSQPLRPEQLPSGNAQFIAYGNPVRVADPTGETGEPLTVRPQTYVVYYRNITIKEIQVGGRNGNADVATVFFDPESVNLKEAISGKVDPDDPILEFLQQQHAEGQSVDVGIEWIRKKKSATDNRPISPLVPIHALRGAEDPSGTKAKQEPTGANTRKMLVLANGRSGKALTSDPTEWASLVNNKSGDLPPEGWRYWAPGDDWSQYGAIVPSNTAARATDTPQAATNATGIDTGALANMIEQALTTVLDKRDRERENEAAAQAQPSGRPVKRDRFNEGKPWDVRASDGRINLGGYIVANQSWTYRWAYEYLVEMADGHAPTEEDTWTLTDRVLAIADTVQADAYGHGAPVDRTVASYIEACRWTQWAIRYGGAPYPGEATEEWTATVEEIATRHLAEAGERVGEYLTGNAQRPKGGDTPQEESQQEGPSPQVLQPILDTVSRSWNDRSVLANVGRDIDQRGYGQVTVSLSTAESGQPSLSYPPVEGEDTRGFRDLLLARYRELKDSDGGKGNGGGSTAPDASPASPEQPESASTPQPDGAATQGDSVGQNQDDHGYQPNVAKMIRALRNATTEEALRSVYDTAKEFNLLNTVLHVQPDPDHGVRFGSHNESGYEEKRAAEVFTILLNHLRTSTVDSSADEQSESVETTGATQNTSQNPMVETATQAHYQRDHMETGSAVGAAGAATTQAAPAQAAPASGAVAVAERPAETDSAGEADEAGAQAQDIADRAGKALSDADAAMIKALHKEAADADLLEVQVSRDGRKGNLRSLLRWLSKSAEQ